MMKTWLILHFPQLTKHFLEKPKPDKTDNAGIELLHPLHQSFSQSFKFHSSFPMCSIPPTDVFPP